MSPVGSSTCPYCSKQVVLDVPLPFGLTSCSHCSQRVWFLTVYSERAFFRYEAARLVQKLFHGLAADQRLPQELQFDPLDTAELVMEFEAELEHAI